MKNIIKITGLLLIVILLCSCKRNGIISEKEFTKIAKNHKLTVVDVKDQFEDKKQVKEAYVADSGKNYQIEYYILDTENNAKKMYETNKEDFKSLKSKKDKETEKEYYYTTTTNDYYMYLSKIENSVLYIKVPIKFKEEAKKIIRELKY